MDHTATDMEIIGPSACKGVKSTETGVAKTCNDESADEPD